jgi:hypothetical protein
VLISGSGSSGTNKQVNSGMHPDRQKFLADSRIPAKQAHAVRGTRQRSGLRFDAHDGSWWYSCLK